METLDTLNDAQRQAVTLVEGPVLVLAGPGCGKTRVLTYRVAHLINDVNLPPYNILAVTFTNKAAREMSERLANLIGPDKVAGLTVGTFHSICARFLRVDGEHVGLARDFVIFDEDDQKAVVKQLLKELELDDKRYRPGAVIGALSRAKNEMIGPEAYLPPTIWHEAIRRLYPRYQAALQQNNGVDFDDLLNLAVQLFQEHPAVLEKYQRRYVYLHVDEFQDTNLAQYTLVKLLAQKYRNLFCVGDEDQSIYGWRGADYRNVMRLREDFPDARVMLLEQNYRSTRTILDAAQGVIRRNRSRHPKNLWTENTAGTPLVIQEAYDEKEEAQFVADEIRKLERRGYKPGDFAVFYRM
ncbi:MAG TPA: UvrD-helicase domain-containing protein, partial [Anaerolineae bacterium]